jgi:mannitol-1-/sugar-/sorbitol-6-phosphatase
MTLRAKGLLFDLDGTLIDSLPAVDRAWATFARKHNLEPEFVLARIHGRRSIDSIRELLPEVDAEAENTYIRHLESSDTEGVRLLPGSKRLLESLPLDRWCLVTSGTSDIAKARLAAVGLPIPQFAVYGEDVERGKPAPDPFLLGAQRLGIAPEECIGFEDTDAGLASVKASGARAVAVGRPPLMDLDAVSIRLVEDGVDLEIPGEAVR